MMANEAEPSFKNLLVVMILSPLCGKNGEW
jgi:hypothetical protein